MKLQRPTKASLLEKFTIGTWITIPDPAIPELLAKAGFDWFTIDLEHSPTSLESAAALIRVSDLLGIRCFVRVGDHNANVIKRLMDAGAHGIIASTVNTPQEAAAVVAAVKYPPKGTRGVGLSRAQGYAQEFDIHYRWLNEESVVIVQIEHIQAVRNLKEILDVPGVDGFFVGPYDLSASLGIPGQFEHPLMKEALATIDRIRAAAKVLAGIHVVQTEPEKVKLRHSEGYRFVAYGIDFLFLLNKAKEDMERVRSLI